MSKYGKCDHEDCWRCTHFTEDYCIEGFYGTCDIDDSVVAGNGDPCASYEYND